MSNAILLMCPLLDAVMQDLHENYTVHHYYKESDKADLLARIGDEVRAVVTDGGRGVEEAVLSALPAVKIVTVFGVGVDAVALQYCKEHKITVTNTPDVLSEDVADMGVALMLAVSRQMVIGDNYARSGEWAKSGAMQLTTRMSGKRAGIFGMGSIGLQLARRIEAFDMKVSYCNRSRRSDVNYQYVDNLSDLAEEVDYLIVAASASPSTTRIINAAILEKLGSDGYLINISRGSLVDESALIDALTSNVIKGAGLDVLENEPSVPDALRECSNVVLQPHHASGTLETRRAMGQVVCDNLASFYAGRPALTEYFIR